MGDNQAPTYFFINAATGEINLIKSVLNIGTNFFRIRVQAYDNGSPRLSTTTYVEVTVIRSQGTLAFTLPSYAIVVSENRQINSNVITTLAQPGTPTYSLLGVNPGPTYFSLNSNTGAISVRSSLKDDPARLVFYQLLVQATAGSQVATAYVNITVTRNEFGPICQQRNYNVTIQDTLPVGDQVITVGATDNDGVGMIFIVFKSPCVGEQIFLQLACFPLSWKSHTKSKFYFI